MTHDPRTRDEGLADDGTPVVEDAAALEAAEEAARRAEDEAPVLAGERAARGEPWVAVATASSLDTGRSLEPVYDALREAGIPAGFDPYRPGTAPTPYPTVQRSFCVVVPESRVAEAEEALRAVRVGAAAAGDATNLQAPRVVARRWRGYLAIIITVVLIALAVPLVGRLFVEWGLLE